MKILKIIVPIIFLSFLYKYSYISFDPIRSLIFYEDKKLILLILILTFSCSLFLYIRFIYCLIIYKFEVNIFNQIEVSSQAYSFASFIPGQIGIDAWRIGKLRKLDFTKFKTNLIKSSILEKILALSSQIFILIFFLINSNFIRFCFFTLAFLLIYFLTSTFKSLGKKYSQIKKYTKNINFKNISILFLICVVSNLISCYLIRFIGITLNMNFSLKVMSISSIFSHIVGVIPISPNGLGVSEFVFSEITKNILNVDKSNSIANIYFSFRILNLFSHFVIYYFFKIINLFRKKNKLNLM